MARAWTSSSIRSAAWGLQRSEWWERWELGARSDGRLGLDRRLDWSGAARWESYSLAHEFTPSVSPSLRPLPPPPPPPLPPRSLRCLRFGGRYGVVGWTSTPYAGGGRAAGAVQETANALPTNLIMMKAAKVFGCPVAIATKHDPSIRPPRLAALDAWIACGFVRPLVSHKSPLQDCGEALMQKWGRKVTGGAVVHP